MSLLGRGRLGLRPAVEAGASTTLACAPLATLRAPSASRGGQRSRARDNVTGGGCEPSTSGRGSTIVTRIAATEVATVTVPAVPSRPQPAGLDITVLLRTLSSWADSGGESASEPEAASAAAGIQIVVKNAVDNKNGTVKSLQSGVVKSGALAPLTLLARRGHSVAFSALQILCYRNTVNCQQLVERGIRECAGARAAEWVVGSVLDCCMWAWRGVEFSLP